jgi:hypothetical protein
MSTEFWVVMFLMPWILIAGLFATVFIKIRRSMVRRKW